MRIGRASRLVQRRGRCLGVARPAGADDALRLSHLRRHGDSGGTYQGAEWDADQFRAAMTAALQADGNRVDRRHKRTQHFLSDSMAVVLVETSMSVSATELGSYTSAILVIKMGTRWCFKGGVEAGHGRRAECPV